MPPRRKINPLDLNPEEKIKEAARTVFHKKGFAATRTRDIAKEAGMNLALLNYYFKGKERLFEVIMYETAHEFLSQMEVVFNDDSTSLANKIQLVAERYIDLFCAEPNMPLFLMSEIRRDPKQLLERVPVAKVILQTSFIKQYLKEVDNGKITEPNPLHFLMNLMGMVVFPFVNGPMFKNVGNLNNKQFIEMMQERKRLIPIWVKALLKAK